MINFINKFRKTKKGNLIEISGELSVIEATIRSCLNNNHKCVFFDVGANIGDYTNSFIKNARDQKLDYMGYLFEPQLSCVKKLDKLYSHNEKIQVVNSGLSNISGKRSVYLEKPQSSHASLYHRECFSETVQKIEANFITGDEFIDRNKITRIDLVKIDTEGNEYNVLRGLEESIKKGLIQRIQFEYGGTFLDANVTLKDIYDLLFTSFKIGKITKQGVNILKYNRNLEDYKYSNYLAIHKTCF